MKLSKLGKERKLCLLARVDAETVKSIARDLPPHYCLALGKVVNDFSVVVKVKALDVKTMGETRLFFKK